MEVVIPECIKSVASVFDRADDDGILRFVFGDKHDRTISGCLPRFAAEAGEDMLRGRVEDLLCRIKSQAIEVKLLNPVSGIRDKELANGFGIWPIEIDSITPFVFVSLGEIVGGVLLKVITVGTEMVVDNVKDHAQAESVCAVDKGAEIIRRAVEVRGRK